MNEFVVKNGLISQGDIAGTGSLVISNNITSSNISASGFVSASVFVGTLTGSNFGTSSWSTNSLTSSYVTSSNVVGTVISASYALSSSYTLSSSYAPTDITSSWSINALTASFLTTTNSYRLTNLTASNISASGTGSFNRIGIGILSPGATLDVTGDARFTTNVGIGGLAGTDGSSTVRLTLIGVGTATTALKFQSVNGIGSTSVGAKVFKGFVRAYVDSTVTDGVNPFTSGLYFIPMYQ